ncbi:MAG: hypothetical protein HQ541_20550 [Mariniphaga sp.]|nr:hypothetical protein [Mariniphaga sp.]
MRNCKSVILIILILNLAGCHKNPCDELDNGVYVYPEEKAKGKSFEESIELYKIPESILECISTWDLVESCIYYPEMRIIWTHSHLQGGFDKVKAMCNGFEELWRREDKFTVLMALYSGLNFEREWDVYTDLENGRFMDNIIRYELILTQNEILLDLTQSEKIELFQMAIEIQKTKTDNMEYYDIVGIQTSLAILARIMYNDNFQPLIEEYENNESMRIFIDYIKILDSDIINIIMNLSENFKKL